MQKIDRLGWAAGISFEAFGVRLGLRTNHADLLTRVGPVLPPGWQRIDSPEVRLVLSLRQADPSRRPGVRTYHLAYYDGVRVARTFDLDEAIRALENKMDLVVALLAPDRIFVHAGVVGWKGRAIVIPGLSFSGKSTLTRALVEAGATYYSDEFAVIDAQGKVHPYARPLALRTGDDGPTLRKTAEELGGQVGSEPLPVGLIVSTHFREGARWRPRVLTPGRTLLALLDHAVAARSRPAEVMPFLRAAASAPAVGLRGVRGDSHETARAILRRLEQ
jgi:hypothetical protein